MNRWYVLMLLLVLGITGCGLNPDVKAPCDYEGHFCGTKQSINQEK